LCKLSNTISLDLNDKVKRMIDDHWNSGWVVTVVVVQVIKAGDV